ncbi:hypothetical protein [uncultured Marivita sp.]|uniref:hypothetical protein n=1 Tax=uncultured Marivita sp. TaxID=888080 RepID=UPI00263392BA|nr:hypothetical protein [uncultured Marivita sp.]
MSAKAICEILEQLGRKATCQAAHVARVQRKTGCTDEEAAAMLEKRLASDLFGFNATSAREIVSRDVRQVLRGKKG